MKAADFLRGDEPRQAPRPSASAFLGAPKAAPVATAPAAPTQSADAFLRGAPPVQATPRPAPPGATAAADVLASPPPPPLASASATAPDSGVRPDLSMSVRPPVLIPPALPVSQEPPRDPNGFPIDLSRPRLDNADGSFSTERSITVTEPALNGGRPTNIPTIWNGREVGQDEAIQLAQASGQAYPAFDSIDQAVAAAQSRSAEIGRVRGDTSPLPEFVQRLMPRAAQPLDTLLNPPQQARTLPAVLDDFKAGGELSSAELGRLIGSLEQGAFKDPQAIRDQLALRLPPEVLQAVDDAITAQQILAEMPADRPLLPGGPSAEAFLNATVRGATLGMVDPATVGNKALDLTNPVTRSIARANELRSAESRGQHPIADIAGEAVGGAIPFALGVNLLRGLRAARGLAPVEEGTAGIVAEGAKVGGPLGAAYRPEGADHMTAEQELTARAVQGGVGVVAGAILDFGVLKASEFVGLVFGAGRDALQTRALAKEAKSKGFDSPEEYLGSLVEFQNTPDGLVVRPRTEALNALPGEANPTPEAPRLPDLNNPPPAEPVPGTVAGATDGPQALPAPTPEAPVDRTPAMRRVQADEYDRLARATTDPTIRQELIRQAEVLRTEAAGEKPKLTPQERQQRARVVDTETDDIVTAIRKLGGLNVSLETDWAGRLSHLPRKGFGLPGIEQTRGGGRSLDGLAEVLHELGYLSRRDLSELEDKLSQAETGAELFSERKLNYAEPDRPQPTRTSTDRDWTYGEVDDVRALDQDFVIDTDNGTVIPSRPLDETDWNNLYEEERNAQKFFDAEGGQNVEPARNGAPGVPARLASEIPGRVDNQPKPGDTGGLPGVEPRSPTEQGLADLGRAKDISRNGREEVRPDAGPGDLFSGRARQRDLISERLPGDTAGADVPAGRRPGAVQENTPDGQLEIVFDEAAPRAQTPETLQALGPRVKHAETGRFPTAKTHANSPADVAHIVAPLRRDAQESFLAVVTDDSNKVLRIARLFKGQRDAASVDPGLVAGAAANTPGGTRVWFVHNHPSGSPGQSTADAALTRRLHSLMRETGVDPQGMIVVAPGGKFSHFHPGDATDAGPGTAAYDARPTSEASGDIPPGRRDKQLPVTERTLKGARNDSDGEAITDAAKAKRLVEIMAEGRDGVALLDNKHRPVGFLPMSAADMARLRQGKGGPAQRLLAALDETNASAFIARAGERTDDVATNLSKFSNAHGARLLDVLDGKGKSFAEKGSLPGSSNGTEFHANPFGKAFADTAREVLQHPARSGAQAFAGAVGGATTSDAEIGTAEWWLDVAKGASLGIAGFQGARALKLVGKGSVVDRSMMRLGRAIERLPLIGRGPEELRELKRKQRVMRQIIDRQTEAAGAELLRRFTPAQRGMMADLIETRGIIQDYNIVHRQAQALDDFITDAAERMKELGMLPDDLETGGYLHRYYSKHLGLDKLFREAKGQSLSGSYTIARGTSGTFDRNFMSPGVRDLTKRLDDLLAEQATIEAELKTWERRAARSQKKTPDLFPEKYADKLDEVREQLRDVRARRKALSKEDLHEFIGTQNGETRSFLFTRDEVPRVDSGLDPRFVQKDRPTPKPGDLAPQRLPEVPGVEDLLPTGRVWGLRGAKGNEALVHRDWTKAERESWGEIDDAGYRYVRGMAEVSHDLSLATLYKTVGQRSDWVQDLGTTADTTIGKTKWIYVPDTKVSKKSPLKKYGSLAGKHVRADVWNGIRNYGRPAFAPGPVGSVYRAGLAKWKLYKTVYNPVTHLNNTYSNFEMLYMSGYKPTDLYRGLKAMRGGEADATWREARDAGLFGTDWSTSLTADIEGGGNQVLSDLAEKLRSQPEIPDAELSTSVFMDLKEWWINSSNSVRGAETKLKSGAAIARALAEPAVKGAKFINRPVKWAARSAQRLYRFEDEVFKMAAYQAERKAGKTPEEAVQAAERLFFDYSDLPEGVKIIRDFPIGAPFISYTYFAVPAIARNIVHNPERVLALVAAYEAWNYGVLEATSDGMGPGEYWATQSDIETVAPPWERGRALWGALNTVALPSPEGYRLALGRSHALGNPFMTEAGGRKKLPNAPTSAWGSSIFGGSPLHSILDVMVNEDWKGKEIYLPGDTDKTKAHKVAAYLYQAWSPSNILTPGGYQQTRLLEGLANDVRKDREAGEPDGLIAPVVDFANQASEALGFGQYTGLDRADNEINTRDQLLSAHGVKLRPARFAQSTDFELDDIDREIKIHEAVIRKAAREEGAGRTTRKQFDATADDQENEIDKLLNKGQDIVGARRRLDKKGLLR